MQTNAEKHHNWAPLHRAFGPIVIGDLTYIPGDLYGDLYGVLDVGGKHNIPLIALAAPGQVNLYPACQAFLLDIFQKAVIMPALWACNNMQPTSNIQTWMETNYMVVSGGICWGAVLGCLINAFNDDGILSSTVVDTVLHQVHYTVSGAFQSSLAHLTTLNVLLWFGTGQRATTSTFWITCSYQVVSSKPLLLAWCSNLILWFHRIAVGTTTPYSTITCVLGANQIIPC
jgi:hypothetical protein